MELELKPKHKKAMSLAGYFLAAAGVGCLVVPVATYGVAHGFIFGLLMAALVYAARGLDENAHASAAQSKQDIAGIGFQLSAVMLIYVVLPAGVLLIVHLVLPSLVVLNSGWQMATGLIWLPLFLASLLNLRAKIK